MLPHLREVSKNENVEEEKNSKKKEPNIEQHDKQFENIQQEFLDREKQYSEYLPEEKRRDSSEKEVIAFHDVDGNVYHDSRNENAEEGEEYEGQNEDYDEGKKEVEQKVVNDHYANYNQDDGNQFRIYFDYENEEEKLPFYTGDIEGYVKHEFGKDRNNLKQKTEQNLENYYRSLEEGDANEGEESEKVQQGQDCETEEEEEAEPENEESKQEEKESLKKVKGFVVTPFSEQTQAQAAPILYEGIDHATAFLSIPNYFGEHQHAGAGFDNNFQKNFPVKQLHQAATQNSEVVQPLYSGIINVGALQELHKSNKPLTIPFDFDYSASEIKVKKTKVAFDNKPAATEYTGYESYYVPEKYTEDFSYTVPEPPPVDYAKLEAKDFKDDDTLSKNAKILNLESGRKEAFLTINGNKYHL
ncbi:uncharacterized protein LOC123005373 [Tribolium madens]|uniref:uncharacterized protein LOC123005373 n=1 Tax=Tribolium madens TaxID=41895 RepID=UPI001CF738AA|nr:uncharacterized protein LOC123005373 [Tribolium madens]